VPLVARQRGPGLIQRHREHVVAAGEADVLLRCGHDGVDRCGLVGRVGGQAMVGFVRGLAPQCQHHGGSSDEGEARDERHEQRHRMCPEGAPEPACGVEGRSDRHSSTVGVHATWVD